MHIYLSGFIPSTIILCVYPLHTMLWTSSIIIVAFIGFSHQESFPTATTIYGKVRGHYKYSYHNRRYAAFEGIPYAKPPINELRFEDPQDADSWIGILNTVTVHQCIQKPFTYSTYGDEDCLYINVYVPRTNPIPNENLDVVVHIHGGAFIFGDPHIAGPRNLMDRDIVYVNFNYRIGVFGFLSTGDDALPGNLGLKDQTFALKWVQNNIKFFGGNANSVTLIGLSSGAGCVHLHYLSPLSRGLFHRGMSQSGVAIGPWVIKTNPLKQAVKLGNAVGCNNSSTNKLVECLKIIPASKFYDNIGILHIIPGFPIIPLSVVIEKESSTAFLTNHPYTLLKTKQVYDVPWFTSITTDEGLISLTFLNHNFSSFKDNFELVLPYVLDYYDLALDSDKSFISKKIKRFYFKTGEIDQKGFVNAFGDRTFKIPFDVAIRMQAVATKSPVYAYVFDYANSFRSNNWFGKQPEGVDHAEDGLLMYDMSLRELLIVPEKLSDSDVIIKNVLLDLLISYAKNDVPKYKSVNLKRIDGNNDIDYLLIKNPNAITLAQAKEFGPKEFWSSLPIKY